MARSDHYRSDDDMRFELQVFIRRHGNQLKAAKRLGISPQYISDILSHRRQVSAQLADKLGFVRITLFEIKP